MTQKFDLCILGSGPAGYAAALRAVDLGKNVCIVEKEKLGGAGVFWGALVSKTLWELSDDFSKAARVDRGYRASGLVVDYRQVLDTVNTAAKEKQYQMLSSVESFHPDNTLGKGSITLVRGKGSFVDRHTVRVQLKDGTEETVSFNYCIIATGSHPRPFPGIEVDQRQILDTNGILNLQEFPKRLLVVGAGIIGCEFATIFSNFRQSEVHLLDHAETILPLEDPDVSQYIASNLQDNGVNIHHLASLRKVRKVDDHLEVVVDFKDGHSEVLEASHILMAIGRVPNTSDLNLEAVGVRVNSRGYIQCDEQCAANDNIFAAGDVTGTPALVNVAEMEGRFIVRKLWGAQKTPLRIDNMPTIMFFKPEVAAVGMNERQARLEGIPYRLGYYSNSLVPRAISMRAKSGFVKILITADGTNRILGMRAAGPQASSLIMSISYLKDTGNSIMDYLNTIHPHPCMTESILECLRLFRGNSLSKPEVFPDLCYVREWKPGDPDNWHESCAL
jgi:dihydrolipoamide dehydrogenase